MKRVLALAMILMLTLWVAIPASAASATLTATAKDCAPGSTVQVAFGLKAGANIAAADFRVSYDTAAFEFVEYEDGDLIRNCLAVGNCKDGKVLYSLAGNQPIMDEGTLFTVTFKVDSKASGTHEFQFYTVSCCDYETNKIDTNTAVAKVTVSGKAVSDVTVTPVTSVDENGSQVVVSAVVDKTVSTIGGGTSSDGKQVETETPLWFWAVCGGIVVVAGVATLLFVWIRRAKANKPVVEHTAILEDDAKDMLDLEVPQDETEE